MRTVVFVFLIGLALALTSSATAAQNGTARPATADPNEPVLRPGDVLRIGVWPNGELGGDFIVEPTGLVYLPFLGSTRVAGVTVEELRSRLRESYGEAMQNPVVTVFVMFRVGVHGAVQRPGVYQVNATNTFFEVVGMAGGFISSADQRKVRIVRESGVIEVDAYRTLEEGRDLNALTLRSGDQIVVPVASGMNWRAILQLLQTGATVALMIDRLVR